jgi:acyl dehydratase
LEKLCPKNALSGNSAVYLGEQGVININRKENAMQSLVYFEDLVDGRTYLGTECVADKEEMLEYARKNDPWPFHADEEAAKKSGFGGIIASAGYSLTLGYRSLIGLYNTPETAWAFLGGLEWPNMKFHLPVRPEDRLRARMTIQSKRKSSKPGRGVVTALMEMLNQDGTAVYSHEVIFLIATRPTT